MRLSEISKDEFHRKLVDPGAQELHDLVEELKVEQPSYQFELNVDEDNAVIRFTFDRFGDELSNLSMDAVKEKTLYVLNRIKVHVHFSSHWVWDTWHQSGGFAAYLIRKN